jgi:alginate O-acetyltransferase complex protein AlgI
VVFSSSLFLFFFLPAFLLGYLLLPKYFKNSWILLASLAFYYWGAPLFIYILLGSTFIDFFIVQGIYKATNHQHKKVLLISSLVMNLGL